jgi:hypothetical protein
MIRGPCINNGRVWLTALTFWTPQSRAATLTLTRRLRPYLIDLLDDLENEG